MKIRFAGVCHICFLVLHFKVRNGNPSDSTLTCGMLKVRMICKIHYAYKTYDAIQVIVHEGTQRRLERFLMQIEESRICLQFIHKLLGKLVSVDL